jgi:glycolate oxidase iron-sulfur subunit
LRRKIPMRQRHLWLPTQQQPRKMLILEGCVQKAAAPNTNAAASQVLNSLGISLISVPRAGCCGALNYHLAAHRDGLNDMRRNIDAWWPSVQDGAEAIVSSASGCGAMLVDYGRLLADDPAYAEKARQISALTKDLGEILLDEDLNKLSLNTRIGKVAVHTPCTLQHALQQPELITTVLANLGFDLAHLSERLGCCGSAGTYSLLQPEISGRLLHTSLNTLIADQPAIIATANIGCQLQLQSASGVPVVHWVELVADALPLQVSQHTAQQTT